MHKRNKPSRGSAHAQPKPFHVPRNTSPRMRVRGGRYDDARWTPRQAKWCPILDSTVRLSGDGPLSLTPRAFAAQGGVLASGRILRLADSMTASARYVCTGLHNLHASVARLEALTFRAFPETKSLTNRRPRRKRLAKIKRRW